MTAITVLVVAACAPSARSVDDRGQSRTAHQRHSSSTEVVALGVLPYTEPAHLMGFAVDDYQYLQAIPLEARTVPIGVLAGTWFYDSEDDYERNLVHPDEPVAAHDVVAFRSYEAAGDTDYVVRRMRRGVSGDYEQWYLLDVSRFIRAVVSIHRDTRRVFFFEIIGVELANDEKQYFAKGGDHCYRCHPSGLRTIAPRADDPLVDWELVGRFNDEILAQGVSDFGADVDRDALGQPIEACQECHDGDNRGALYPIHHRMIRYRLEASAMPPDDPLPAAQAAQLMQQICDAAGGCAME